MSFRFLEPDSDAIQAAHDLERALLHTLNRRTLPATPKESATPSARRNPFWYRCMYMLAILAEAPRWGANWTARKIVSTLAIALEEEAMSSLRYRPLSWILTVWRLGFLQNRIELARFLERVEPEILVLTAGAFADGAEPLTLPAAAALRPDLSRDMPSRRTLLNRIQGVVKSEASHEAELELADFLIGYAVRYLEMTPRGYYNLACYCSNGAERALGARDHSRWVEAASGYLFDGLSGLDRGMDAWARVDLDLKELRRALGTNFDTLVQKAKDVRSARFALYGSPNASLPVPGTSAKKRL